MVAFSLGCASCFLFQHILDLGSITDVKKTGDYVFLVISKERLEMWSIEDVHNRIYGNSTSYFSTNEHMHFVPNTDRILIVEDNNYIHEFNNQYLKHTSLLHRLGNGAIHGLQAGISKREMFLYYNERVSENNAFVSHLFHFDHHHCVWQLFFLWFTSSCFRYSTVCQTRRCANRFLLTGRTRFWSSTSTVWLKPF